MCTIIVPGCRLVILQSSASPLNIYDEWSNLLAPSIIFLLGGGGGVPLTELMA
ncbi:MAG: hypothetical protein IID03_11440 [Candidatus Dadabacteria bacterium]|nr:hypothetical protein [Candidatus Dadabacteria bacterium]